MANMHNSDPFQLDSTNNGHARHEQNSRETAGTDDTTVADISPGNSARLVMIEEKSNPENVDNISSSKSSSATSENADFVNDLSIDESVNEDVDCGNSIHGGNSGLQPIVQNTGREAVGFTRGFHSLIRANNDNAMAAPAAGDWDLCLAGARPLRMVDECLAHMSRSNVRKLVAGSPQKSRYAPGKRYSLILGPKLRFTLDVSYTLCQNSVGNGGFGKVFSAVRNRDQAPVAIKVISKIKCWCLGKHTIPAEICMLTTVTGVSNVVKILDFYDKSNVFVIILSRPKKSMDLYDYLTSFGPLTEKLALKFFKEIVEAVWGCYKRGVLHRDLKDENIIIDMISESIILIDFGSGAHVQDEEFTEFEGTRIFSPPEWIMRRRYDGLQATVWSLGCLLHSMLTATTAFVSDEDTLGGYRHVDRKIPLEPQELIKECLRFEASERICVEEILCHPWLKKYEIFYPPGQEKRPIDEDSGRQLTFPGPQNGSQESFWDS